VTVPFVERDR